MNILELNQHHVTTRDELRRVATHFVARRRGARCGRFGLRATPGGIGTLGPDAHPAVVQLSPERFDVDVATGGDRRANLGASAGDGYLEEPYLYVGPWDDARPGDPAYWNAPFVAVLRYEELRSAPDPVRVGGEFLLRGVALLSSATTDDAEAPTVGEGSR